MMDKLAAFAEYNPIHRDALLHKVRLYEEKFEMIRDREQFQKLIDAVESILSGIELLLERQFGEKQHKTLTIIYLVHLCC